MKGSPESQSDVRHPLGMDTCQFAKAMRVGAATVRRWINTGTIKAVESPGGRYFVPWDEVAKWTHPKASKPKRVRHKTRVKASVSPERVAEAC